MLKLLIISGLVATFSTQRKVLACKKNSLKNQSQAQVNRKRIQSIRCKSCHKEYKCGLRKCKTCEGSLEWLCECGVWRSYSNLASHSCLKTKKREELKKKFRKKKKLLKKNLNKAIESKPIGKKSKQTSFHKHLNRVIFYLKKAELSKEIHNNIYSHILFLSNLNLDNKIYVIQSLRRNNIDNTLVKFTIDLLFPLLKKISIKNLCSND